MSLITMCPGKIVMKMLWAIALQEDNRTVCRFDDEWAHLVEFVNSKSTSEDSSTQENIVQAESEEDIQEHLKCSIDWINTLYNQKRQWVRRFIVADAETRGLLLGHVRTTQRDEALNRVIAEDTSPSSLLTDAFKEIGERQKLRHLALHGKLAAEFKNQLSIESSIHPVYREILNHAVHHIAKKLITEISLSNNYVCKDIINDECQQFQVTHRDTVSDDVTGSPFERTFKLRDRVVRSITLESTRMKVLKCSCLMNATKGYPCRLLFFVYRRLNEDDAQSRHPTFDSLLSYLHPFWRKSSLLPEFGISSPIYSANITSDTIRTTIDFYYDLHSRSSTQKQELVLIHENNINDLKVRKIILHYFSYFCIEEFTRICCTNIGYANRIMQCAFKI